MKRIFDITAAALGILVLAPLFAVVAVLIKLDSVGPIVYKQERVGRGFRRFWIYKFRTMVHESRQNARPLTVGADPRITRVGWFLRKSKIDELPQLWNVLKGDMALVGPRPEVPRYVEMFRNDYEVILEVRPGLTDLASLKYRDEASILGHAENPEVEYVIRLLPDKIRLAKEYIQRSSLAYDLRLIARTILKVFVYRSIS
jgi:lipopolysaccharide/colanic/teichoic acid biosynthesis glycosyltransferase